ncbi:molybdate ABC transporter substrate-binding protein [Bosea sp. CS1GBMeth4]|uniref:molybdate ABC transporter substrate-binding protein n=1 Tax=Bosea sp. CS1GBMeth4 TaxID=1892849 RepID=UPI00164718FB|nr:molybdate ABC transporter substrate-binding protein [Bosea sp. CS1GBMeth4]
MRSNRRHLLGFTAVLLIGSATLAGPALGQGKDLVIFAAASLKNALDEAAGNWAKDSGRPAPKISYAASNVLAKQLEQGAPADLFLSADLDWMDYAQRKNLIRPDSRVSLLANRIVLIAPADARTAVALTPGVDLAAVLGSGRLAMANVESVPAGKYGKAALEKLGGWDKVKDKLAQADNVRAALLLVSRGEAPLGIVYATDAAADPKVKVVATFPEESHPPIVYPVAITRESGNPDAQGFLSYLRGSGAKGSFEKQGFTVLNKPASSS